MNPEGVEDLQYVPQERPACVPQSPCSVSPRSVANSPTGPADDAHKMSFRSVASTQGSNPGGGNPQDLAEVEQDVTVTRPDTLPRQSPAKPNAQNSPERPKSASSTGSAKAAAVSTPIPIGVKFTPGKHGPLGVLKRRLSRSGDNRAPAPVTASS